MSGTQLSRTRWAAVGAAVAVTLGAGSIATVDAVAGTGERAVYTAITPCRLVDTRPGDNNVGPRSTPLGRAETDTFSARGAQGRCSAADLPADAVALAMNVTALGATTGTFLTIWPGGERPLASSLNPTPGQPPVPNAVTTELSASGSFDLYNKDGSVHVVLDVVGYYTDHHHDDRYDTSAEVDQKIADATIGGVPGPQGPAGPAGADGTDLFTRTVVVNGDGTDEENGDALIAAVASVSGASISDPALVLVEPGVFDVGSATLDLPAGVSVQGSGKRTTRITGTGNQFFQPGESSTISDLWIETTRASTANASAMLIEHDNVSIHDIYGTSAGDDVIDVESSAGLQIDGVEIDAADAAIDFNSAAVDATIRNSDLRSATFQAMQISAGSSVLIEGSLLQGGPGADVIDMFGGELTIRHSSLIASGGASVNSSSADSKLAINNSYVDVSAAFGSAFTAGTATCSGLSTPTGVSNTTCL